MTNVRIGDLVFHGGDGHDGFFIRGGGLEGLQDGVDSRRDSEDRPNADGVFPATTYLSPRVVAIGGDCEAPSAEKLDYYSSKLKALQANRAEFTVMFDMPGKKLSGKAHFSDKPTFKPTIWGRLAEWDIELQFDNPRLLGASKSFAGVSGELVWAHHYGNFTASPKVRVSGSMHSGYTVWGPGGRRFTVTVPVVSAFPHTIDMHTGLLWVNGAVVHGAVTFADTWGVPAGGRVEYQLTPVEGSGSLLVTVEDTFI